MLFSYSYCWWQNQQWRTNAPHRPAVLTAMEVRRSNTDGIARCGMSMATPEAPGRRHRATTCSILPQRPPGQQSTKQQSNNTPILLAVWWPLQCSGTIPRILPNRGGSGLQWKPLVATIGWVLRPIVGIEIKNTAFYRVFFIVTSYKRDWGDVMDPNNNKGMTYQLSI